MPPGIIKSPSFIAREFGEEIRCRLKNECEIERASMELVIAQTLLDFGLVIVKGDCIS